MTNTAKLKYYMLRAGVTQNKLAELLGISPVALSYKINNKRTFTVEEIAKIKQILNLSDSEVILIFFTNECGKIATSEN